VALTRTLIKPDPTLSQRIDERARRRWYQRLLPATFLPTTRYESETLLLEQREGIEQLHVTVVNLRAHEVPDAGPFLFLDCGDGSVLFLGGEWLYDPTVVSNEIPSETPEQFWETFTLLRSPGTGIVFALSPLDSRLIQAGEPVRRGIPDMGESHIFQGSSATLDVDLNRVQDRRR
jgi:hypothetical protein